MCVWARECEQVRWGHNNNNNNSDTWMIRLTLLQIAQASNFPLQMFLLTFACINWVVLIQLENKGCCRRGTINEGEKHRFRGDEIIIWNINKSLPSDSQSCTLPMQKSRFYGNKASLMNHYKISSLPYLIRLTPLNWDIFFDQ